MNIWIVDDEINLANGLKRGSLKKRLQRKTVKTLSELNQFHEDTGGYTLDQRLPTATVSMSFRDMKQYPSVQSS